LKQRGTRNSELTEKRIDSALTLVFNELQIDGVICSLHAGIPFFVFRCVVTKELLQKEDPRNQNIQLFPIDFYFGDFTNNPESRVIDEYLLSFYVLPPSRRPLCSGWPVA